MIPYGDVRKSAPVSDTQHTRDERRRAAAAATAFGNRNHSGPLMDFSAKTAPAAPSSGMGVSFADAYAPSWKAEQAEKDARAARLDALPQVVQKLATEAGVTDLPMLEAVAIIHRASKAMNGPAQVFESDIGRSLGITTQRAEELTRKAAQLGFIEPLANSYWRCKL
ncbi:hypothetical protein QO058_07875 [Bosea vestrisii]|uniref:hypothetical protein n=1 Tax=Bosea vestrisii TaxID=151416 RepID=UPI0024DF5811|nr:hypothetical protein [Bosea vestrisii]WID98149.1 hypothetical protein QO058_07875 [Bosea vestrisii]